MSVKNRRLRLAGVFICLAVLLWAVLVVLVVVGSSLHASAIIGGVLGGLIVVVGFLSPGLYLRRKGRNR